MGILDAWWFKLLKWLVELFLDRAKKVEDIELEYQLKGFNKTIESFEKEISEAVKTKDERKRLEALAKLANRKRIP